MAGDAYKRVTAGDKAPRSARLWNDLIDLARESHGGERGLVSPGLGRESDFIKVKNATNSNQPKWAILGIDTPLILPANSEDQFARFLAMNVVAPLSASHQGKFVVLQEPLAVNAIGRAQISGVTPAYINTTGVSNPTSAEVTNNNSNTLTALVGGSAQILYTNTAASQPNLSMVRLQSPPAASSVGARVYLNADTVIVNGLQTALPMCTTGGFPEPGLTYDTGGFFNANANTLLTAPADGYYHVGAWAQWAADNAAGERQVHVCTHPGNVIVTLASSKSSNPNFSYGLTCGTELKLAQGASVKCRVYQDSTANQTVLGVIGGGSARTAFWIRKVG